MKHIVILITLFLFATHAFSQKWLEEKALAGINLALGTRIASPGFNAVFAYQFTKGVRIAPNFSYFFPNSDEFLTHSTKNKLWELNVDANFMIPLENEKFGIYGVAGPNLAHLSKVKTVKRPTGPDYTEEPVVKNHVGVNIGVGGEYRIKKSMRAIFEIKYSFSEYSQTVIKTGMLFRIKKR